MSLTVEQRWYTRETTKEYRLFIGVKSAAAKLKMLGNATALGVDAELRSGSNEL